MYKVYWTDASTNETQSLEFDDMTEGLKKTQLIRNSGGRFVCMASENVPGNVTKIGVAETGSDYNWKKRR